MSSLPKNVLTLLVECNMLVLTVQQTPVLLIVGTFSSKTALERWTVLTRPPLNGFRPKAVSASSETGAS